MVAAKISSNEVLAQIQNRYIDNYFEIALINSPSTVYTPGTTDDASFMQSELTYGTGGYARQIIGYTNTDIGGYADQGIGLARKAAIFTHNGSTSNLTFSHVVMLRGDGNILSIGSPSSAPSSGTTGTYTNIPATGSISGKNLLVNVIIFNNGATAADWTVSFVNRGYSFAVGETIRISNSSLVTPGATSTGTGDLTFPVTAVSVDGGQVVGVTKTDSIVTLGAGNQAVFYFDLKQYGYFI